MMHLTKNQRIGLVYGGALVAGGLATLIARQAMAATTAGKSSSSSSNTPAPEPQPLPAPQVQTNFTPVTTLTPGGTYLIAAAVPSQYVVVGQLLSALQAAGWPSTPSTVLYFGPAGDPATNWPNEMPYPADPTTMNTMYVAAGVYAGTSMPVPAGAVAYQLTSPVAIPGTATVVPYKGAGAGQTRNILVTTTGLLWYGNVSCPTLAPNSTLLPNNTVLAIGSSAGEVTSKLATWLNANCP